MTMRINLLIAVISTLIFASAVAAQDTIQSLPIDSFVEGCGCLFWNDTGGDDPREAYLGYVGTEDGIKVVLNGEPTLFERKKHEQSKKHSDKISIGDRTKEVFTNKIHTIRLEYRVVFACPPDSEGGCEVTKYKGVLTIFKGKEISRFSIRGSCGC